MVDEVAQARTERDEDASPEPEEKQAVVSQALLIQALDDGNLKITPSPVIPVIAIRGIIREVLRALGG